MGIITVDKARLARDRRVAVLEILCRVFDDGADAGWDEWLSWYKPDHWLSIERGLGAFIRQRLEAKDNGMIHIHPEPHCGTCGGPGDVCFPAGCAAGWAHRFVRAGSPHQEGE